MNFVWALLDAPQLGRNLAQFGFEAKPGKMICGLLGIVPGRIAPTTGIFRLGTGQIDFRTKWNPIDQE